MGYKQITTNVYLPPSQNRSVGYLSDGSIVMAVVDESTTPSPVDIWIAPARGSAFTKVASVVEAAAEAKVEACSIAVDDDDALHVAFAYSFFTYKAPRYAKVTKSGSTWTVQPVEVVGMGVPTGDLNSCGRVDIDVTDTGLVVMAMLAYHDNKLWLKVNACPSGGNWQDSPFALGGTTNFVDADGTCSCARNLADPTDGAHTFMVAYKFGPNTGTNFRTLSIADSTGAITDGALVGSLNPSGDIHGKAYGVLFSEDENRWSFAGVDNGYSTGSSPPVVAARMSDTAILTSTSTNPPAMPDTGTYTVGSFASPVGGVGVIPYRSSGSNKLLRLVGGVLDDDGVALPLRATDFTPPFAMGSSSSGANRNRPDKLDWLQWGGSAGYYHFWTEAPTSPVLTIPSNNQVMSTAEPTVAAGLTAPTVHFGRFVARFEIADASDFSSPLSLDSDALVATALSWPATVPQESRLSKNQHWIRVQGVDPVTGDASSQSSSRTFTTVHPPGATGLSPNGATSVLYDSSGIQVAWSFTDPWAHDSQTAYQVIVERNDTGVQVADTGKVTSTATNASVAILSGLKDITLRWKVKLWDLDDKEGDWSQYATFKLADAPTVTITSPDAGDVVATPAPTIEWTFTPAVTGNTQAQYQVSFLSGGSLIYASGWIAGDATSYQPPSVLPNHGSYVAVVEATEIVAGLVGSGAVGFSVAYTGPTAPSFFVTDLTSSNGYVRITWDDAAIADGFLSWRVYRHEAGSTTWELLDEEFLRQDNYEFHDWTARAGISYVYAVVQAITDDSAVIESDYNAKPAVTPTTTDYWLIYPADESKNVLLHNVTSDSFDDEYDEEVMTVIGRGRKTDYGTHLGVTGSVAAQLWDRADKTARQQRLDLNALKAERAQLLFRTPFGDLWPVSTGNLHFERTAGVGAAEYGTISFDYRESVE